MVRAGVAFSEANALITICHHLRRMDMR
jgi:hypothetical protein